MIRRVFRDLYAYARRNPIKLFTLVILPLLTGGALHNILRRFGIRLPAGLAGFGGSRMGGSSFGGLGGRSGFGGMGGGRDAGGLGSIMRIAQMFM